MSESSRFDPRLTPARPDLAAASLRGQVEAERFTEGEPLSVLADVLDVKRQPRPDAPVDTQLLFGEKVMLFDETEGWGWVQAQRDGYVGYVAVGGLGRAPAPETHRIIVNRTFVYPAADMKQPIMTALPLDGRVAVVAEQGLFAELAGYGFVIASHLAPLAQPGPDYVAVAEQLIGAPYLWGGKSVGGIDCSGLVQLAASVVNVELPRDTDLQEQHGQALPEHQWSALRRGDLVFWKGHVGIMTGQTELLHANGHHMLVTREPLDEARSRIAASNAGHITSIRRNLSNSFGSKSL